MKTSHTFMGILVGALLAVLVGTFYPALALNFHFLGELFLNALKMMVLPLIVSSLVVGVTHMGDAQHLGKMGIRTLVYYMSTTFLAVVTGLAVVQLIKPGLGFEAPAKLVVDTVHSTPDYSFMDVLMGLIHPNLVQAAVEFKILPIIIASILFGAALMAVGEKSKPVVNLFKIINDVIMKIVHWIILFAPLGIFGLIAHRLGAAGGGDAVGALFLQLGKYCLAVVVGLFVHGVIVLPLIFIVLSKRSIRDYVSKLSNALLTAFATASSSATLPLTMEATEKSGIPKRVSSFVLPLGATINMDGTALYEAVAALFIAQVYGVQLDLAQQCIVVLTASLAAIGAAGIPEAGLVTMVLVLQSVGLPVEGIGLILAVDWILDRCRTTINVWGDAVGAAVVSRFESNG
jgi:solute carrier family 1 (neuronal/epithelial high affinity glutamate transporter), member 1